MRNLKRTITVQCPAPWFDVSMVVRQGSVAVRRNLRQANIAATRELTKLNAFAQTLGEDPTALIMFEGEEITVASATARAATQMDTLVDQIHHETVRAALVRLEGVTLEGQEITAENVDQVPMDLYLLVQAECRRAFGLSEDERGNSESRGTSPAAEVTPKSDMTAEPVSESGTTTDESADSTSPS